MPPSTPFLTKHTPSSLKEHQESLKNCMFGGFFTSSLIFDLLSLPIFGLSSKFYCTRYPVIIEVGLAKVSFSMRVAIKSYGGKRLGAPLGIRRVKASYHTCYFDEKHILKLLLLSFINRSAQFATKICMLPTLTNGHF